MTRSEVIADRRSYTVSGLEPRAVGDLSQAIVIARLIDDLTGSPVSSGITVTTATVGARPRVGTDGYAGVVATPSRLFPALASQPSALTVQFGADGYAPRRESVAFPLQAGFPASFPARDLGDLALRRDPVTVEIRTFQRDAQERQIPLALVPVTLTGHWRTVAALAGAPATDALLPIARGLSAPRPIGATIDVPALLPAVEPPRVLAAPASPGQSRVAISRTDALTAGDLVGIDLGVPDRREWVEVVAVQGPSDPASPAVAVLRFALRSDHAEGAAVQRIPAPAPAASIAQTIAVGLEGDRTLVVSTLAGLGAAQTVRIGGGAAAPEYRVIDGYDVVTDAQGFARMPALTGVAGIEVSATSGALGVAARVSLTRRTTTHGLDLTLT